MTGITCYPAFKGNDPRVRPGSRCDKSTAIWKPTSSPCQSDLFEVREKLADEDEWLPLEHALPFFSALKGQLTPSESPSYDETSVARLQVNWTDSGKQPQTTTTSCLVRWFWSKLWNIIVAQERNNHKPRRGRYYGWDWFSWCLEWQGFGKSMTGTGGTFLLFVWPGRFEESLLFFLFVFWIWAETSNLSMHHYLCRDGRVPELMQQ